jgi:hypothetical protein
MLPPPPANLYMYLKGIKFYDPEIVGDTPEAVEYKGLQNILAAVGEHLGYTQGKVRKREAPHKPCSHIGHGQIL